MRIERANFIEPNESFGRESSSADMDEHTRHSPRQPLTDEEIWGEPGHSTNGSCGQMKPNKTKNVKIQDVKESRQ